MNRKNGLIMGGVALLSALAAAGIMHGVDTGRLAGDVPPAQRAQIEAVVRDYILSHPEIIPEAMQRLQDKQQGDAISAQRAAIETPFAGAWEGNPDGDVTLVEYFDYACGYCRASLPHIDKLLATDKNLKVVYRELPILSPQSDESAKASLVAAKLGKYPAFHRALYAAGGPGADHVQQAARKAGISPQQLAAGLKDDDLNAEIEKNIATARALGTTGTPTWVIGDQMLVGAVGYEALKDAIAKARAK